MGILMYWSVGMKCVKSCVVQAEGEGTFDLQDFLLAAFAKL